MYSIKYKEQSKLSSNFRVNTVRLRLYRPDLGILMGFRDAFPSLVLG